MSPTPRDTIKRSVSLGFAVLALCIGCSDSDGGGGGAGGTTGNTDAGASSGGADAGTSGAAGSNAGAGKGNECDIQECLVANTCLDHCGGSVVYTGCCACVPPAVNRNGCAADK